MFFVNERIYIFWNLAMKIDNLKYIDPERKPEKVGICEEE